MARPRMHRVRSAAVEAVGYDAEARELCVRFTGGATYAYLEVPEESYRALLDADSIGAYVNHEIKPHHFYREV